MEYDYKIQLFILAPKIYTHSETQLTMQYISNEMITIKPFAKNNATEFVNALLESEQTVGFWMSWWKKDFAETDAWQWFDECEKTLTPVKLMISVYF